MALDFGYFLSGLTQSVGQGLQQQQSQRLAEELRKAQVKLYEVQLKQSEQEAAKAGQQSQFYQRLAGTPGAIPGAPEELANFDTAPFERIGAGGIAAQPPMGIAAILADRQLLAQGLGSGALSFGDVLKAEGQAQQQAREQQFQSRLPELLAGGGGGAGGLQYLPTVTSEGKLSLRAEPVRPVVQEVVLDGKRMSIGFDPRSGQPLYSLGEVPETPIPVTLTLADGTQVTDYVSPSALRAGAAAGPTMNGQPVSFGGAGSPRLAGRPAVPQPGRVVKDLGPLDRPITEPEDLAKWRDPRTGAPATAGATPRELRDQGFATLTTEQTKSVDDLDQSLAIMDQIDEVAARIFTGPDRDLLTRALVGKGRELQALTQSNPDLVAYQRLVEGRLSPIVRALGERGALAEGDVERAVSNFAKLGDNPSVALQTLGQTREVFESARARLLGKRPDRNGTKGPKSAGARVITTPAGGRLQRLD